MSNSAGYKAEYLEDPDTHYAKITAMRDPDANGGKVSWADIGAIYGVSDRAVSRWYKRETKRKNDDTEQSAIKQLAELKKQQKNGQSSTNVNTNKINISENKDNIFTENTSILDIDFTEYLEEEDDLNAIMDIISEAMSLQSEQLGTPKDAIYEQGKVPIDKIVSKVLELQDEECETPIYPERWAEYQLINKLPRYGKLPPTGYRSTLPMKLWLRKYMGWMKGGFKWDDKYLDELDEILANGILALVLLPRGHGKTMRVFGHVIRYIAEIRKSVLYVTTTSTHAKKVLINLFKIVSHPVFRRDYGDIIASSNKQDIIFEIHDDIDTEGSPDYLLQIASRGSEAIIGSHPSWLHLEDIIQEQFKSTESNESIQSWLTDVLNPMMSMETNIESRITATGTRKGTKDIYKFMIDTIKMNVLHRRALTNDVKIPEISEIELEEYEDESGNVRYNVVGLKDDDYDQQFRDNLLNSSMSANRLLDFIFRNGTNVFSTQMQNLPVPSEGRTFNRDWWDSALIDSSALPDNKNCSYFQWTDPAYGESDQSDRFASLIVMVHNGIAYVVDGFVLEGSEKRYDLAKTMVRELHLKWMPDDHWIDANYAQRFHKENDVLSLGVTPYRSNRNDDKQLRIEALTVPFQQGIIKVSRSLSFLTTFLEEYLEFEYNLSKNNKINDDCMDCLSGIIDKVRDYLKYGSDQYRRKGIQMGLPDEFRNNNDSYIS